MPTYEYGCEPCGLLFEEKHGMGKAPKAVTCSECSGEATMLISGGAMHFVRGTHKNSQHETEIYDRGQRPVISREALRMGITVDQYERIHEKAIAHQRKVHKHVDQNRRQAGRKSDDVAKIGSIPMAEFLARKSQVGSADQALDPGYWKSRGRIFKHAEDRVEG